MKMRYSIKPFDAGDRSAARESTPTTRDFGELSAEDDPAEASHAEPQFRRPPMNQNFTQQADYISFSGGWFRVHSVASHYAAENGLAATSNSSAERDVNHANIGQRKNASLYSGNRTAKTDLSGSGHDKLLSLDSLRPALEEISQKSRTLASDDDDILLDYSSTIVQTYNRIAELQQENHILRARPSLTKSSMLLQLVLTVVFLVIAFLLYPRLAGSWFC